LGFGNSEKRKRKQSTGSKKEKIAAVAILYECNDLAVTT